MRILIADDDVFSRKLLETTLKQRGHQIVVNSDGQGALEALLRPDAPQLAILDWMMPNLEGPEICRRLRAVADLRPLYLILLTSNNRSEDISEGLLAGANDYVTKPFDRGELFARVEVGIRVVQLQQSLEDRVRDLEAALRQVKQLQGLLPICCYCKSIRNDQNYWMRVEQYMGEHGDVRFSHGICPDCWKKEVEPQLAAVNKTAEFPN